MSEPADAVYLPTSDPNTYEPTELANAGWYQEGQHGGALAALIGSHVATVPTLTKMRISRMTLEIFRVVPLVPLTIETQVVREGKKIQVVEAHVSNDGLEVCRARFQRLRIKELGLPDGVHEEPTAIPGPAGIAAVDNGNWGIGAADRLMFHRRAVEIREVEGGFDTPGPGKVWIRLITPLIAGAEITPLQRLLSAADFVNGVSNPVAADRWQFMNPDLTVTINRLPRGEWVALDARSDYGTYGSGMATGSLWDEISYLGRSTQTLFLDLSE